MKRRAKGPAVPAFNAYPDKSARNSAKAVRRARRAAK